MSQHSLNASTDAAHLYLDFLKLTLTRILFPDRYQPAPPALLNAWPDIFKSWLQDHDLALVKTGQFDATRRTEGRDWPSEGETMIGMARLNNLQHCIESILWDNVAGDFLEAGVWRGGASIFARAVLKAYGISNRTVWLADSFQGLPKPDVKRYAKDKGDLLWASPQLAVSLEAVKDNFRRYGLLDEQVAFIPGWFRDTLPTAPVGQLALLRLDGDLYESTIVTLRSLYPKLAAGGYVIVDDYNNLECCKAAVDDFRAEFDITEPIVSVDWSGVYWRVERTISPIGDVLQAAGEKLDPERSTDLEYEPALHTLLLIYEARADLQAAFPEAANQDYGRLIEWARRAAEGQYEDSSAEALRPFLAWYAVNSASLSQDDPWELLEATTRASSNPLPYTLQEMRSPKCVDISQHLITLALLIQEFDLKQIVEVGTRDGHSTVALLEAGKAIGSHVLSVDIEPCPEAHRLIESLGLSNFWTFKQRNALELHDAEIPEPIDLLFIDTFHLYSQTLAELRKFVKHLRPGSWIVLHDTVSFPGVSKALLETIESSGLKVRFYPFVHQNGLTIARLIP
jgi:O-methyltransferase